MGDPKLLYPYFQTMVSLSGILSSKRALVVALVFTGLTSVALLSGLVAILLGQSWAEGLLIGALFIFSMALILVVYSDELAKIETGEKTLMGRIMGSDFVDGIEILLITVGVIFFLMKEELTLKLKKMNRPTSRW